MKKPSGLRPGQPTPLSGQYQEMGPRGGPKAEITSVAGKPLPPTHGKGGTYRLVDATKHKK